MLKSNHSLIVILFVLLTIFQNCKPKDKVAPGFPPKESMDVDLSYFDQLGPVGSYYEFSQQSLQKWKSFINDSLAFYRQIFNEVLERNLEFQTNNTWLINFSGNFNTDIDYEVSYFEKIIADTIESKLFVSYFKKSPYTNKDSLSEVLIMDGEMTNYEYGDWTINLIDTGFNNSLEFLTVEWKLQTDKNPNIKFTNLLEGNDKLNSLHYKDSINAGFLYYIDLLNKADENHTYIQWNSSSNLGRLKDVNQYGNENWHCWDEDLSDMVCPAK